MIKKLLVMPVLMSSALFCMEQTNTVFPNQTTPASPSTIYSKAKTFANRIQTRLFFNREQRHKVLANGQMRQEETNAKQLTPYSLLSMDQLVNLDEVDEVIGYGAYVARSERANCDPIIYVAALSIIGSALLCILASN